MRLPLVTKSKVYHVGHFLERPKGKLSFEGRGLSVSEHPAEWRRIARLNGPTWALRCPNGTFIDYHALTDADHASAHQWAERKGWIVPLDVVRVEMTDEEGETCGYMSFDNRDEALVEADGEEDRLYLALDYRALPAMEAEYGYPIPLGLAGEFAMLSYLEHHCDADGLWWNDMLQPLALSAPRGMIFPHRIQRWARTPVMTQTPSRETTSPNGYSFPR